MVARFVASFVVLLFTVSAFAQLTSDPRRNSYRRRLYDATVEREVLVGSDARLIGLGASGAALSAADGLFWNPATLATSNGLNGAVSQTPFAAQSARRHAGLSFRGDLNEIGAADAGYVGFASWLEGWGDDEPKNRAFAFGYATPREAGTSVGVAVRHDRRYYQRGTFGAWGLDLGLHYTNERANGDEINVGLALTNLAARFTDSYGVRMGKELSPLRARLGGSYAFAKHTLVTTELSYHDDRYRVTQDRFRWTVGGERWLFDGLIGLRLGYNTAANYDRAWDGLMTVGASVRVAGGRIDYAYANGKDGLGGDFADRHLISMSLDWIGLPVRDEARPTRPMMDQTVGSGQFILPDSPARYVRLTTEVFSPNGDLTFDTATFRLNDVPSGARLEIRDASDALAHTFDLSDSPESVVWDGSGDADGLYTWNLVNDAETFARGAVIVDATAPSLTLDATPVAFIAGSADPVGRVTVETAEANVLKSWSLEIRDGNDAIYSESGDTPASFDLPLGDLRPGKRYKVALTAEDEAGNRSELTRSVTALDLRNAETRLEGDALYVEAPSTAFEIGQPSMNRDGRTLAASFAAATEDGFYVVIGATEETPSALSRDRVIELRQAMEELGANRDRVSSGRVGSAAASRTPIRIVVAAAESMPESLVSVASAVASERPASGGYRVLIGSFRKMSNADQARASLAEAGFASNVEEVSLASGQWRRVVVGAFASRADAEATLQAVRRHVESEPIILSPPAR